MYPLLFSGIKEAKLCVIGTVAHKGPLGLRNNHFTSFPFDGKAWMKRHQSCALLPQMYSFPVEKFLYSYEKLAKEIVWKSPLQNNKLNITAIS